MSVINQMLKDLDQRQAEQGAMPNNGSVTKVQPIKSNKLNLIVIVLIVLILNAIGLYVWTLYQENQSLKLATEKSVLQTNVIQTPADSIVEVEQPQVASAVVSKNISEIKLTSNTIDENLLEREPIKNNSAVSRKLVNNEPVNVEEINSGLSKIDKPQNIVSKKIEYRASKVNKTTSVKAESKVRTPKTIHTVNTVITPIKNNNTDLFSENELFEEPKKSSLSISRRKLSPQKLVQQKIKAAERSIIDNDILKAERLFEEVLLITPEHKSARKQLGALWFGRKLFKPAINLLSQGVVIHPNDIDFRLMKARILLNQKNNTEAFNVLNGLSTAKHVEYQVLLANTAQLLKRNNSAILAYEQLVSLESYKGKWWLGLAIALDRSSAFDKAKTAYNNALTKHDLSENSARFIRQRLNELGE